MKMPLLIHSELPYHLNGQVRSILEASEWENCGLILAQVNIMGSIELQDLETRLGMEDAEVVVLPSYGQTESLLVILFPGQPLAYTHFLSLSAKDFLQNANLLTGKMTVASFPESAQPTMESISEMIDMATEDSEADQEIAVYYQHELVNSVPNIVMIDQNTDLLQFLSARLGLQGYDVRPAQNGLEGLQLIKETPPDLIITELTLPAMDGYQLIHRIRQSSILKKHCKIMVLTDMGLEQEVSKCFDLGVSDVIRKPFSPIELDARIRRLLS